MISFDEDYSLEEFERLINPCPGCGSKDFLFIMLKAGGNMDFKCKKCPFYYVGDNRGGKIRLDKIHFRKQDPNIPDGKIKIILTKTAIELYTGKCLEVYKKLNVSGNRFIITDAEKLKEKIEKLLVLG